MQDEFMQVYNACYNNVKAYIRSGDGSDLYMTHIMTGVIQGCTSVGFIFGLLFARLSLGGSTNYDNNQAENKSQRASNVRLDVGCIFIDFGWD